MARQILWAIALLALVPSPGRASEAGLSCDHEQASQQRGGHPQAGKPDAPGDKGQDHPPRPKWWIDAKLRGELGITDQQSAAIEKVWQKQMPSLIEGRESLEKLEEALSQMTATADEAAVIVQIGKVEDLRAQLAKGRTLMIYRMNKLLTADQRAKVKEMYERREPPRRGSSSSR